jgi:DNA-binding transcriptional ArsR family regulator
MAVTLTFPSDRPMDLIGFAWSPLFEAVLSLRSVAQPKRTPMHLPWVRRCRELPEDLQDEIAFLVRPFDRFVPGVFEVGLRGDSPTFAAELAAFEALDDDLVAYELSIPLGDIECGDPDTLEVERVHDPAFRDAVIATADATDRGALARQLFDDPAVVRDRYARMLQRYWDEAFRDEWNRLLPRIEAEVTAGARALVTAGAPGLVEELLPEGRWDAATSSIVIAKDWDGACDIAERGGLLFVPTVYGWPCVLIDLTAPWPASVFFPLRDLRTPEVPHASDHEVVAGFSALGDETRLQIARLVAEHPRSTKELAELLSLSDSAISRHLKILDAAGLVSSRRDGYFVLYRLEPERLDVLSRALRGTLGLLQSASGDVPALPVSLGRTAGP